MKNNFNLIAPVYDILSKTIFGNTISTAQKSHLDKIEATKLIVIVGGGSGKILHDLDQLGLELDVFYVELSGTMLDRAKTMTLKNIHVDFVCADALHTDIPVCDIVITNFFLDVFTEQNLNNIMKKLDAVLRPEGIWLCTDFLRTGKFYNDTLIRVMYLFFRLTANLEGDRLCDFEMKFKEIGFQNISSKTYSNGMIMSTCYKRV